MAINDYDPVADLYDIYVPVDFDVDFFVQEAKKVRGEVLELMSGSGRVSIPLVEAGVQLTCVDLSAGLNAILERKLGERGLKAEVVRADIRTLALGRQFAAVIIPFHSFAHLTSPEDQRQTLERIHQHLLPGGMFICTLANPDLRQKAVDGQMRLLRQYDLPSGDGTLLLWVLERRSPQDERVVEALQFYEVYDSHGVLREKRLLELHFRLTRREEFEAQAAQTGFAVQAIYGDYAYSPLSVESPFMVWILKKVD